MFLEKQFQHISLLSEFVSLAKSRWALISVGGCHKSEHVPSATRARRGVLAREADKRPPVAHGLRTHDG